MDQSLLALRRQFPHTKRAVFFDHANFGPSPNKARRLLDRLAARFQALDPRVDQESFAILAGLKRDFGKIVGARQENISFLPNTTTGTNQVLLGLRLRPSEHILLAENEFPSLAYPILHLARIGRAKVNLLPCPQGHVALDDLDRALARRKTALFAISWVQYFNGYRYDPAALAEICHRHGTFLLLDGTQGVGAVPLNMIKAGIDALVCGGQKWLFCQTGSGFMCLHPQRVRDVKPELIGWLSVDWKYTFTDLQRHDRQLYPDGRRFEWGTYPYYSLRLAQVGLELIRAAVVRRTFKHVTGLLVDLADYLRERPYDIASDPDRHHRSGILAFTGPYIAQLHQYLSEHRVRVSFRENNIRVSPHFYNTPGEMRRCIKTIDAFGQAGHRQ
jgi:cysteine desulfurase/selenocysteine lyase